jgi:methionyl-tRNA synthetase
MRNRLSCDDREESRKEGATMIDDPDDYCPDCGRKGTRGDQCDLCFATSSAQEKNLEDANDIKEEQKKEANE